MTCPGCGFEAPPDFAYCPKCGGRLAAGCPSCGAACSPDFTFCPRCGARLDVTAAARPGPLPSDGQTRGGPNAAPVLAAASPAPAPPEAPEGDRRPASVVFADVTGFTALSERLDPEEVRAFQDDLLREMASAIGRYEGFLEKFVGDAVMAVFGAPTAHEDDPERALRAALAMRDRMEDLNARWGPRAGRSLALHVGVNTGPVVAGTLGIASGGAYAVTGDTVNTAARLQAAARPREILVGPATCRLTQHAFAFEPAGELTLKGKAEPLPAYRLVGVLEAHRPGRGLEALGLAAPMVGRNDELGQMLAALDRTLRGRAQVVSLVGEAGVGKSRLLREFFLRLEAGGRLRGTTVRRAMCSPLGGQAYGVAASFFREAYGVAPDDTLEAAQQKLRAGLRDLGADEVEAARIAPVLGYVLGLESGDLLREVEPEQLKRQIFLAHRMLLERRLEQGPLLLVVEDLHWADAASMELLRFLVDRLADRPLMLLSTCRPAFAAGRLLVSRAAHTTLRLMPLRGQESEALLGALFGASASRLPAGLRDLIVRRAGGNPLYLEEVLRSLIAGGALVREDGGWACRADPEAVELPATLQSLLLARLDRLPPQPRRLIQEAAVLGPTFDLTLLRTICSEPAACEASLERLQEAELVEEIPRAPDGPGAGPPGPLYRFTHALVQEVVYQNVLLRRRGELHGRAGEALEALCGGRPQRLEDLEALGHHFSLSADQPRGARYLVAAGDWASAIYANEDAVRHYQRALQALAACRSREADGSAVRERLGDVLGRMGQRAAALEHYGAVAAAAESAGDMAGAARAHRKIGGLYWDAGDRSGALARCQRGLALLADEADHIELAHLYQEMGRMAFRSGDNQGAVVWAKPALAQAERVAGRSTDAAAPDDPEVRRQAAAAVADAYNTLGVALARMGRLAEAVGHVEQSIAVAEAQGLPRVACRGSANLGVLYSTLEPRRAIETCTRGLELAKKTGDLGFQSRLQANLAVAYCALTDRCDEEGVRAAQAAIDLDRQLGQIDHLPIPLIVLGQIYQCHGGDPARALACYREALELAEQAGEPQLLFPCYDGLGTLYLEMGDAARAEEYMRKAQQVCREAGVEPESLMLLPFLC